MTLEISKSLDIRKKLTRHISINLIEIFGFNNKNICTIRKFFNLRTNLRANWLSSLPINKRKILNRCFAIYSSFLSFTRGIFRFVEMGWIKIQNKLSGLSKRTELQSFTRGKFNFLRVNNKPGECFCLSTPLFKIISSK